MQLLKLKSQRSRRCFVEPIAEGARDHNRRTAGIFRDRPTAQRCLRFIEYYRYRQRLGKVPIKRQV